MDETSAPVRSVWPRYFSAFKRHKIIVILPLILALEASLAFAFTRPHKYTASTTVSFDTPVTGPSALEPGQPLPGNTPAQTGQAALLEQIGLRKFLIDVGHKGPLAARLTAQHVPPYAIDDKIVSILKSSFAINIVGPTIVGITMTNRDPNIIDGTLDAVVDGYRTQSESQQQVRADAAIVLAQSVIGPKKIDWEQKFRQLQDYQAAHPTATAASDQQLQLLSSAALDAQNLYNTAQIGLAQAQQGLKNVGSGVTYRQVDKPQPPVALARKKKIVFGGVAGLFAGAIVSLLLLAALANGDRTARRPDDIEDLEVVGNISEFPRSESDTTRSRRTRSS